MTPERQRIVIAEVCGWKECEISVHGYIIGIRPGDDIHDGKRGLPDYLNSLDAMHEAENAGGTGFNKADGIIQLMHVIKLPNATPVGFLAYATATQRAEAFLRTVGKWEC